MSNVQLLDRFRNKMLPVAIEKISNNDGTALKFADGTLICCGNFEKSIAVQGTWGSIASSGRININLKFAEKFKEIYSCTLQNDYINWSAWVCEVNSNEEGINWFQICRGNSATSQTYKFSYIAIGTWK